MKNIVSGTEMKRVDSYTIEQIGIPSIVLMERAALSVADLITQKESKQKKILVVAGVGNNGADGLAVGRMLYLRGYSTCICILGDVEKGSPEFQTQLQIAKNLGVEITDSPCPADVVVDAIFGVGLSRDVEGRYAQAIEYINGERCKVYAVDIPSGINADTGKVCGVAVHANETVTFGAHKIGTVIYPGADYCGNVHVADIGFPQVSYEQAVYGRAERTLSSDRNAVLHSGQKMQNMKNSDTADIGHYAEGVPIWHLEQSDLAWIPPRANYSNKGTYGKILVIAGSKDITGAAYLCAKAAFRMGAGLVRVFTAQENREVIQRLLPEAMVNTYDTQRFDAKALQACLHWCDVVAVGPGLSTGVIQKKIVEEVLDAKLPTVIDADGINNIAEEERLKKKLHSNVILTPHLGEMSRLMQVSMDTLKKDLIGYARKAKYQYNVDCILKDARTVIATKDATYVNLTGNSGMATAGSGDVLTGIVAGLLGIGVAFERAAALAPYLHGMAGDIAAKKCGKSGMMASDLLEALTLGGKSWM